LENGAHPIRLQPCRRTPYALRLPFTPERHATPQRQFHTVRTQGFERMFIAAQQTPLPIEQQHAVAALPGAVLEVSLDQHGFATQTCAIQGLLYAFA
jgi:hypothetical protein